MWNFNIIFFVLLATSVVLGILAFLISRKKDVPGRIAFVLMLLMACEWSFFAALEAAISEITIKILFSKLVYIGSMTVSPLFFHFVISYINSNFKNAKGLYAVWVIPIASIALVFTNETHRLFWTGFEWSPAGMNILIYNHGVGFFVAVFYSIVLMIITVFLLLKYINNYPVVFKKQSKYIILAAIFPAMFELIYSLGFSPLKGLDISPIGFAFSGLFFLIGLAKSKLFNVVPFARDRLFNLMSDGIILIDVKNIILDINCSAVKILKTDYSIVGIRINEAMPEFHGLVEIVKLTPNKNQFFIKNSGKWIELTISEIKEEKMFFEGNLVIIRDITEKKTAEEISKISEDKYKLIADNVSDVIWTLTPDFKYSYVSPSIYFQRGYLPEEILNADARDLFSEESKEKIMIVVGDFLRQYENKTISPDFSLFVELEHKCKNGEYKMGEVHAKPIYDSDGILIGIHGVTRDITARKQIEKNLIEAKERAEEMSNLKTSFLANMSHELRTPLNGILGFAELLRSESNLTAIKEMSEIIYESGKRLLNTLNMILDLSRLESGIMEVKIKKNNVVKIVSDSVKLYKAEAARKNIYLKFSACKSEIEFETDEVILLNTLNNLINNAIKFTEIGGVEIRVDEESSGSNKVVVIKVTDTGIGISNENLKVIFDEFRQASEGWGRTFEGTGLGLALCKKYMTLIGGEISVRSEKGKGSTFIISLK